MPHVRFSECAVLQIKNFVHLYEEGFFMLYKDSGIWAEDAIIEHYQNIATTLNDRLFAEIEWRLSEEVVLGRKERGEWSELVFHVGDRLIVVYFSESSEHNMRVIEYVGIDRKPIIF